jgi:NAD(P)-dependent dehydrogenase (short-subunit alcohol dehydrogenase family)
MDRGTALITGAGSGFGLLTAVELARRGFRVCAGLRDLSRAERLDEAARAAGVAVEKLALDVTDERTIAKAVGDAGPIDVLVNNAGYGLGGFLEDVTMDELRLQFETNFFGLVAMTKAVIPGMRERRRGHVINVSSISGRFAAPGVSAYCSSKWAVEGLSESLRHELRPLGVWVTLVEPGTFRTDIFGRNRRVARRADDPGSPFYDRSRNLERVVERNLARSTADPQAVADVIAKVALSKRPRLRYLVGKDARGQAFGKAVLPFRAIEWGVQRYLGEK